MDDLLERLRSFVVERGKIACGSDIVSACNNSALSLSDLRALLAALEAAREDGCVALVADIRFACGDNGKRMQPELVEFIRDLAEDAERLEWLLTKGKLPVRCSAGYYYEDGVTYPTAETAIDQARRKEDHNG